MTITTTTIAVNIIMTHWVTSPVLQFSMLTLHTTSLILHDNSVRRVLLLSPILQTRKLMAQEDLCMEENTVDMLVKHGQN